MTCEKCGADLVVPDESRRAADVHELKAEVSRLKDEVAMLKKVLAVAAPASRFEQW